MSNKVNNVGGSDFNSGKGMGNINDGDATRMKQWMDQKQDGANALKKHDEKPQEKKEKKEEVKEQEEVKEGPMFGGWMRVDTGSGEVGKKGEVMGKGDVREITEAMKELVDRVLVGEVRADGKQELRMTLGEGNLKGVEVVVTVSKGEGGKEVSFQFMGGDQNSMNFLSQNQGGMMEVLKQELSDYKNIHIDIQQGGTDSGKGGGREQGSRNEYIEEQEQG